MQRSVAVINPVQGHIISNAFEQAMKELTQARGTYGNRYKKRACAVGVMSFYHGRIDPNKPNSLRPQLLPDDIRKVWLGFNRYLNRKYRHNSVSFNDCRKWDFATFKEEAITWESMTLPDLSA